MAFILKVPFNNYKNALVFTTQELNWINLDKKSQNKLKLLKNNWILGIHHNWNNFNLKKNDLFDFEMAGKGDLIEINKKPINLIPIDCCNFPPKFFKYDNKDKYWDIFSIIRPVFFKRILKKKGLLFLTTTFIWPEHEVPYDFRRFTSFGIKRLFEKDFKVLQYKKLISSNDAFHAIIDYNLTNYYKNKHNFTKSYIFSIIFRNYFKFIKVLLRFVLIFFVPNYAKDNFYLGNLLICKKK